MNNIQIGFFRLEKEETFRNHFETAAWHQDVLVQPGEYPVFASFNNQDLTPKMKPGSIKDTSISCRLEGTVIGSDFSSLFAGNRVSSKIDSDVGNFATHLVHPYAHTIAHAIVDEEPTRFQLNDEFHARKCYYVYNGELESTAGIYMKSKDLVWQVQEKVKDYTILYTREISSNIYSVMAFHNNQYHVGKFNPITSIFDVIESFPTTETKETDYFIKARQLFLEQ